MRRARSFRWTSQLLFVIAFIAGCTAAGTGAGADSGGGGGGPMLRTTRDSILFGRDLVIKHGCGDCHGGGDNPAAPGWLDGMRDTLFQQFRLFGFVTRSRNITPDNTTGIGRFSERQIFNAMRFGLRPGETPDVEITSTTPGQGNFPAVPKFLAPPMPWPAWRHMSDVELWTIAAYLKRAVKPSNHQVADSEGPPDFWAGAYSQFIGPMPSPAFPTANETVPPQ